MASSLETLVERVMGELHNIVRTETVVGEPVQAGEVLLIPVSKISFGFGAGGGRENKGQSGTGGGAMVQPIAFVVIDSNGKAEILTLGEKEGSLGQVMELVPELVAKIKSFMGNKMGNKDQGEEGENQ